MILFTKWATHTVKSYIYCVNQFLREKRFQFFNVFDLLISRTQKIEWWLPVSKPDFYIYPYNEQLKKI